MPELPEVENICLGLSANILGKRIVGVAQSNKHLRRALPDNLAPLLKNATVDAVNRRGRYILLDTSAGALIIHLGMTGSLQIKPNAAVLEKHEHFKLIFADDSSLCYRDPRRFGLIVWAGSSPLEHELLQALGVEPLSSDFTASALFTQAKDKRGPIKIFLMDNSIVTGIGNIYVNEILFAARVNPLRKTNSLSLVEFERIVVEAQRILQLAIQHGGTTIRDYVNGKGEPGAFQLELKVYGQAGSDCPVCTTKLVAVKIGQRSTFYCPACQKI